MTTRTPWQRPAERVRDAILHGTGGRPITLSYKDGVRAYDVSKPFEGVVKNLERRWRETDSAWVREEMSRYQAEKPCAVCQGARLKPEALAVKVGGSNIAEASELSIRRALDWFGRWLPTLTPQRPEIARRILREIEERLQFLVDVGLDYLTLARGSHHAVGRGKPAHPAGEPDRLRPDGRAVRAGRAVHRAAPARQRAAAGHAAAAKALGNTVLVVEHDEDAIRAADYLIDMGPARGHERRRTDRAGDAGGGGGEPGVTHGRLSVRAQGHRGAEASAADTKGRALRWWARGQQPEDRDGAVSAGRVHLQSPACRAAASRRW